MMSTGLTFGTISALYGLTHNIISREQYSFLVAAVIASAVIPTLIANKFFLPEHLLPAPISEEEEIPEELPAAQVPAPEPESLHQKRGETQIIH